LTAFIIESKKLLEQDQTSTMVDVMIFYTNNLANGNHTLYTRAEFQPSSSDITINCLFFASLSLSLVTALASVVALQWVGDYDNAVTRGSNSPADRAKHRHFRHAGVVWWKMGEVIAALPVLLFCSVALFFTGLILWMLALHQIVGLVVAGGAAIALLFFAVSTFIGVVSVSAPFRTPLTRGITLLYLFSFAAIYWLARLVRVSIPLWLARQYDNYTVSEKRDEREVESRGTLGRDALLWLANQLSISHGSARRFMLLVSELGNLKEAQLPSFELTEAPWYSIFDLAGWAYMTSQGNATEEERYTMATFLRCYRIQKVRDLVHPAGYMRYITGTWAQDYWSQYCGTADGDTWHASDGPNHLFLLLRDIPVSSNPSSQELEVAIRMSHWRNLKSKPPQKFHDILSRIKLLPAESTFGNSCEVTLAQFCLLHNDVVWNNEHTEMNTAVLQLQVKWWPSFPFKKQSYAAAMTDPGTLVSSNCSLVNNVTNDQKLHLQHLFRYPIRCASCLDGPGHLLFHLLEGADSRRLGQELIPFIEAPSDGRMMEVALILLCMWCADADLPLPLNYVFGAGPCLRQLERMVDAAKSSEYNLLMFIWNVLTSFEDKKVFTEDLAAILAGVHKMLQLPPQPESIRILGQLPLCISNLLGRVQGEEHRSLLERRRVSEVADITIKLLRNNMAIRPISGWRNNLMLSCARATNNVQPATRWLAPYGE
jgi:Family of unknown function (DUF6535)